MPSRKALLLSIKPRYAQAIFDDLKEFEFRRICPRTEVPALGFLYESAPVSRVTGLVLIEEIFCASETQLAALPKSDDPFREDYGGYLKGAKSPCAIRLSNPTRFEKALALECLFPEVHRPPQSYRFVTGWQLISTQLTPIALNRLLAPFKCVF
jgi:predicted transcriptional regulator